MIRYFFRAVEGLDEDGMEPHSAAYHELKVNSSKWLEECPEFPFEERVEDYPTWQNNLAYLNKFTDHFGLRDTIKGSIYPEFPLVGIFLYDIQKLFCFLN